MAVSQRNIITVVYTCFVLAQLIYGKINTWIVNINFIKMKSAK